MTRTHLSDCENPIACLPLAVPSSNGVSLLTQRMARGSVPAFTAISRAVHTRAFFAMSQMEVMDGVETERRLETDRPGSRDGGSHRPDGRRTRKRRSRNGGRPLRHRVGSE